MIDPSVRLSDHLESLDEAVVVPVRISIGLPGAEVSVEVRATVADAFRRAFRSTTTRAWTCPTSQHLDEALRVMVPAEERPPSMRQLAFAATIAKTLAIELPARSVSHARACAEFIAARRDSFENLRSLASALGSMAGKVRRWRRAAELLSSGIEKRQAAATLGLKRETTVDKYLLQLAEWQSAESPGVQRVVAEIIERSSAEGDIYAIAMEFVRTANGIPSSLRATRSES